MSKNIVICSDGTGNTAIKGRGTNVFKLFEAVDLNGHRTDPNLTPQIAIYDDGVGTESFKPLKILGGATGFGLARNVRQLYSGLVRIYDPDDRIFLFGFSRGAFTVRTLAGLIAKCGVLDRANLKTADDLKKAVNDAYRTYRRSYRTLLGGWLQSALATLGLREHDDSAIKKFKQAHSLRDDVHIAFVGVWDTVDAVGTPFHISDFINVAIHRFKFPDHKLSPIVDRACHAISIDDARETFHPLLWEKDEKVQQVWFAGVHSNVGGGYPKQGVSLVTLDWMMQGAGEAGLRILQDDRQLYREHGNVDDKLYDSRAGLAVFYRWLPRDMRVMCHKVDVEPLIHLSAVERITHGTDDYAPGNLAPNAKVVITPTGHSSKDAAAWARARAVELVLHNAHWNHRSLLSSVRGTVMIGRISYYVYVSSCLAVVMSAAVLESRGSQLHPWIALKNAVKLIYDAATGQYGALVPAGQGLLAETWLLVSLLAGLALSALLASYVDHRMSGFFSQFWHGARQDLREALKKARQDSR
jgi:uncharacterized protein (DUF2235 family)